MYTRTILKSLLFILLFTSCNSKKNTISNDDKTNKLYENEWFLVSWTSKNSPHTINTMEIIQLKLDNETLQLSGNDGCNQFFASYEFKDEQLTIGPTGGTKKYCGEESSIDEKALIEFLQQKIKVDFVGKKLQLKSGDDILLFSPTK